MTLNALPRRAFLRDTAAGMGLAALATLSSAQTGTPRHGQPGVITPHLPVKAKRVIWLYMAGGMSHLESFDPKPELTRYRFAARKRRWWVPSRNRVMRRLPRRGTIPRPDTARDDSVTGARCLSMLSGGGGGI